MRSQDPARRCRSVRVPMPLWIGLLGFVVSFVGSWIPSLWRDEAATAYVASHDLSEILGMARHIDGVYGLYYTVMHVWTGVVGISPLTVRLPSAIAVGVGAAAVAAIGARLDGRGLGIAAGTVFALLPRMTAMGIEARSYALCAAAVAGFAWLLLRGLDRPRVWLTAVTTGVGTLAVYLHLYAVLVVGSLWLSGMLLARSRRARIHLSVAVGAIFTATVPLVLLGRTQSSAQISWIDTGPLRLLVQVLVEQYFPFKTVVRFTTEDQYVVRAFAWALSAVAAAVVILFLVRTLRTRSSRRGMTIIAFTVPSIVLPTLVVLVYSVVVAPAYTPKYLIGTVPAFALLLAAAVLDIRRLLPRIVVVSVLIGLTLPIYVAQRQPFGKFVVDDYSFIAATIRSESRQGDLILFEAGSPDPVESGRNALSGYPDAFQNIIDVASEGGGDAAGLVAPWSSQRTLDDVMAEVERSSRVWLVTTRERDASREGYLAKLQEHGFTLGSRYQGPTHEVLLLSRAG